MNEKYVFIKPYTNSEGTIPEGTEIMYLRGNYYMNGGLIAPSYQGLFVNLIGNDKLRNEYLRKVNMIHNKV